MARLLNWFSVRVSFCSVFLFCFVYILSSHTNLGGFSFWFLLPNSGVPDSFDDSYRLFYCLMMNQQQQEQPTNETNVNDQQLPIDVGIEATTLPLYDSKKQLINCSEELFKNIKNYITSEIECKHIFFSFEFVSVLISSTKWNLCIAHECCCFIVNSN